MNEGQHDNRDPDEDRIREKAYHLWVAEGRPEGREKDHWELARELVAIEDSQRSTLLPPPLDDGEPIEPVEAFENQADVPGLTDQGEGEPGPSRRAEAAAAKAPDSPPPTRRSRP